jgi:soluble lytic murein transglycosylase-like protein
MPFRGLRSLPALSSLLLLGFAAFPAGAAERALLSDGRVLVCLERQPAPGGWACLLEDGGEAFLAAGRIDRFEFREEPVALPVEVPADQAPLADDAPLPERLNRLIATVSKEFEMDPRLVEAVAWVESRHDPFAVSPKGAAGVMQLMPGTARELAVADRFDMEQNVRGGVKLLKQLSDSMHGNLSLVLAAYNAGQGAVTRAGGIPPYRETRRYVASVLERYVASMGRDAAVLARDQALPRQ